MPTRFPANRSLSFKTAASATAADGSTTIFIRSQIRRMALMIWGSVTVITPATFRAMIRPGQDLVAHVELAALGDLYAEFKARLTDGDGALLSDGSRLPAGVRVVHTGRSAE